MLSSQRFEHLRLANGLDLIAEVDPAAQSTALGFMVKTGSRDETPDVSGVAHFLEHMLFKGTATRSAEDVNREFDDLGARNNAFTSNEITCYYANVLPEFTFRTLDLLADMMRPALRQEDFDVEKKVILEEIALYLDRPGQLLFDVIMQEHFGTHPLSHLVLGTAESVGALTREQMRGYFDRHYGPGNMTLAVAGNVDFAALARRTDELCGAWPRVHVSRAYPVPQLQAHRRHIHDPNATRHYVAMLCPGPSAQDDARYAAQVLGDVMGDHEGSRLFWSLIEPGLADEIELSYFPHDGTGSFLVYVSCDPERARQVEQIVLAELARARAAGITDAEIERSKNKIETATVLQGELPLGRMRALAGRWLYNGDYATLDEELACLEAVDAAAVNDVLKAYPFGPLTIATLGPGE